MTGDVRSSILPAVRKVAQSAIPAGYAENITVSGAVYVATGGEVADVTIVPSGSLYLYGGAILDGVINVTGMLVIDDVVQNAGGQIGLDISGIPILFRMPAVI